MEWGPTARSRCWYRDRAHQDRQLRAAVHAAGGVDGKTVCDVGCGYGDLIYYLPVGCVYYGVDPDRRVVRAARRLWPDREFAAVRSPRRSLGLWWRAAEETLVVVTCLGERLPDLHRQVVEEWFPEPPVHEEDDFRVFAVRR